MGRRAPFVLSGLLFLLGVSVAQDAVRTKAQGPPAVAPDLALSRVALTNKRPQHSPAETTQARANYQRLPLSFEPNQGQAGSDVQYLARGGHFNVFLTHDEVVFSFARRSARRRQLFDNADGGSEPPALSSIELRLEGASPTAAVSGVEALLGKANYLVGHDPKQWHLDLPTFAKVRYRNVYPGIDLLYYGNQGELESDFIIAPGANPEAVKLSVAGAEGMTIDASGDLILRMQDGALRLRKPLVYQESGSSRQQIAGSYVLAGQNQVGFRVAQYDHSRPLVIDPVLSYSTYLGGNGVDEATAIAVDSAGNAYITGDTTSTNFPVTGAPATGDMFVAKLDPNGAKVYATYVGGTAQLDFPTGIGVDVLGNAYVAGQTGETNLPTTAGALRTTYQGGTFDGFVFSLNAAGTGFNYFTYLGGSAFDLLAAVAVDSLGNAYITGQTSSGDYPTASPFETLATAGDGGIFTTTNSGTNWSASTTGLVNKNITVVAVNHPAPGATAIYAATSESGVIKSTDSGASWSAINTGLTSLVIQALVVDPVTPANVYVGTGSGGVFSSTTGGTSWATMNAGLAGTNVHALAIDPTSPGTLYASTGRNGVFKFSGGSWSATGTLPQDVATAIVVDPTNNQNICVSFQNSGVYRSSNGGTSWVAFNTGLASLQVAALAIDHGGHLYAGTRNGGVFLSTSGGNWATINTGLPLGVFQALATDPTNNTTVYVGTWNGGVYRSTNNGASWSEASNNGLNNVRISALVVDPQTPANLYAGSQNVEAVVTKLSPSGALAFSSYLGGGGGEAGLGIAVDGDNGNLYVAGFTNSLNFPTVAPAQATMAGGASGFVSKVKSDGSGLVYSTYLGGPLTGSTGSLDQANAIAADAGGNAYVTGVTNSTGFPVTNATQATLAGTSNAFVARYDASGQKLFATYLGGESTDAGNAITVTANTDGSTSAWVAGQTTSQFFPVANPIQLSRNGGSGGSNAGFISDFNFPASGAAPTVVFSTFLGTGCGSSGCDTIAQAIGHDGTNNIYVAGRTASSGFPTVNAVQPSLAGAQNAFIAKIGSTTNNADLSLTLNSFTPSMVVAGGTVSFSLTVTNNGPNDAANVALGGRGGANLTIITCTATQGICGDNLQVLDKGFAELGTMASGASATVTGVLRPLTPCGVTGVPACPYVIVVDARSDANDPNLANNSVSTNLTVLGGADLGVTLSESPAGVQVGGTLTYTAAVTNLGPSLASNVTAVLTVSPAGAASFVSPPTGCTPSSNTLTCVIGPMNPGISSVGELAATVNSLPITATVTVSNIPEGDPNPANNTATVSTSSVERFLVTDFDNNALRVFNLADSSSPTVPIRTGRSATGVAVSPNRRVAYVGNLNSDYASVIDLTVGREIARIHNVRAERNLALSRDGTILVVPDVNTTGLAVIDAASFNLIQNVPLADALGNPAGSDFLGSVVVANNRAFVNTKQANLPVVGVDLELLEAEPISGLSGTGPGAGSIAATPDGSFVLAIRQNPNDLYIINTTTLAVQTVSLPSTPYAVTVVPNPTSSSNTFGFVAHSGVNGAVVSAIDLRSGSATFGQLLAGTDATLTTFASVRDITSSGDGSRLVAIAFGNGLGDNVAVLDATPVRGCSNQPAACAPPTVLSHARLGDTQSGFTSVVVAFADTAPPSTAPTLTNTPTPATVAYGSGTTVTFTGTNFASDTFVRFGTSDPVAATLVNPTTITAAVPANTPAGSLDVTVTARGAAGSVSQQNQSTVLPQSFFITNPTSYHPIHQAVVADTGGDEVDFLDVLTQGTIGLLREQLFNLGDRPLSTAMSQDGTHAIATSFSPGNLDFFDSSLVGTLENIVPLIGPYGSNGGNIFGQNDALAATVYPPTGEKVVAVLSSQNVAPVSDRVTLVGIDPNNAAHFQQTVATFSAAAASGATTGGIAATPDGTFLYANDTGGASGNLVIFNTSNGSSTVIPLASLSNSNVTVSAFQSRVYVAPDGKTLLLATDQGQIAVFDISGSYVSGSSQTSPKLIGTTTGAPPAGFSAVYPNSYQVVGAQLFAFDAFDSIVQMYSFNPAGASFALEQSFIVPGEIGFLGADLAVTPDASLIYVVLEGQDQVLVLDANAMLAGSANPVITRMATGANPIGIAVSPVAFPQTDLAVGIATNPSGSVAPGGALTYTMTGSDKSATSATEVAVVAAFTPALTVSSVTTSLGTCTLPTLPASLGSFACVLGTVAQAAPATITITATAPATALPCSGSSLGCITAVASAATGNQLELNPADNTAVVTTPISGTAGGPTTCTGTTTNWLGGTGNWSDATKWSTGVVPNSTSVNVCIDNGNPVVSQVTLDISASVGNLTIDANDSLTIGNNTALVVAGNIANSGQIFVNAAANNTFLQMSGPISLTGGGTVTMSTSGGGTPFINRYQNVGSGTLTNVDNTIQGQGVIGNNGLVLVNQATGTIKANAPAPLLLNSNGITNAGLLTASGGGTLQTSTTINNAGGAISSTGSGSAVQFLNGTVVQGGTLNGSGGGVLGTAAGNTATLDGTTQGALNNAGTYTGANNSATIFTGTINNTGIIQTAAIANNTFLQMSGAVTLTGSGTVTLATTGSGTPIINRYQNVGSGTLTNVNNTIQGQGEIGNNGMVLINQAAGTIKANLAAPLLIDSTGITNAGLLEAIGGGTLQTSTTVNNAGGLLLASGSGSIVQLLNGTAVQGGTLNTTGGATLGTGAGQTVTLDGTTQGALNHTGTYTAANNSATILTGAINNTGAIQIAAIANNTFLQMSGAVSLTGAGSVTMSTSGNGTPIINRFQNVGSGTLTNVDNTIQGQGEIGNNGMALVNSGTVDANVAGKTLTVDASSPTNAGVLEATGGGLLALALVTINNKSGIIRADAAGSTVQFVSGVTLQSGTLAATNGGVLGTAAGNTVTLDGSTLGQQITLSGTYTAGNNSATILVGTINNAGSFLLNAAANNTFLQMSGAVSLTGAGSVTMSTSGNGSPIINRFQNVGSGTLTNLNNTILGQGQIGNNGMVLVNQAIINASVPGRTLTIDAATPTNTGTLEATSSGILAISGSVVNNQGGTIAVNGAVSVVQFASGATIQGGNLATSNGGVLGTAAGASITLDGSTHGALTNAGTYVAANNSATILLGTINNPGAIQIAAAANNTFLQMSGTVNLTGAGTVTLSTTGGGTAIINRFQNVGSGTLANVGNTVQGQGVIGNNGLAVVNQGAITANLSGVGSYSQTAGSTVVAAATTASVTSFAISGGTAQVDGTLNAPGGVSVTGTGALSGTGSINGAVSMAGVIQPGDAPAAGILTVTSGSYTQSATGALNILLGGSTPGTFSQLNLAGAASLGGTFNAGVINGFNPAPGSSFTILTSPAVSGAFASVNLPALWQVVYNPTSVAITVGAAVSADIAVAMTASPSPAPVLGSVRYQITATNNGPNPASGVTLTDILPANTVFASIDDLTDCAVSSGALHCNFSALGVGSTNAKTVNLILVPLAVPAETGTFDNTATAAANEFDPTTTNNSATQTVQVTGTNLPGGGAFRTLPGLSANPLPGNDDDSAGPVPMNLNLNFFGLQVSTAFVNNNGNITFNSALGDFTPFPLTSTSVPIIAAYFADVETDFPTSGQVTYGNDTVNARPAFGVNWPGVEYCCGSDPTKHNLFQLLLVDRSDVGAGDFDIEFNYDQIQWETGDASGGSGGLGGSPARVGYSNGSQTAGSFFELPGSGVSGSFLDTNTTSGLIYNSLNSTQPGRYVFQVRGGTVQSSADLAIGASGPQSATAGSTITYTLTATNLGPNAATGVTVTNTLPAGFTFVSAAPSGICSTAGQPVVVTCDVGSLANGANAVITIQAGVPLGASGPATDIAAVSVPNNQDLNLGNNTATVVTNVAIVPAVLSITKTHSGNFAQGQSGAAYTITVSNAAGAGATNGAVTVTDTVPSGLTATAINGTGWTCPSLTSCNRADSLAAGASYPPITLTADVAFNAPASVTNTATVSGGGAVNPASANDVATILPAAADLVPVIAIVPPPDAGGTTISYAITVTNNGPSSATQVQLTNQLVGNAGFVSASSPTMTCPAPAANSLACTVAVLNNGASALVNITVNLTGPGWDSNTVQVSSQVPDSNPSNNVASVQKVSAGGNTVTGSEVAVQPVDGTTGASPAILTFASVTRGGTTTISSSSSGAALPAGFRTGTPAVFYNLATTAGYSGAISVALGFNGVSFHHPANVRLFHYESGAWVDRTVAINPAGGFAIAQVTSLSPFALFEPINHAPDAKLGAALTTAATSAQGAKVTLNGSASIDTDHDPLTYRWTGPFPEGNGVVTGVSPTVTMPAGANTVTLVVNDGEADSKPEQQVITVTDFSVAATVAGPTTISAGGSVKFNVTASQQFGPFASAIELVCLGLPQGTQCSFSPNSVNAAGAASTLSISTTARTSAVLAPAHHTDRAPLYALWMPLPGIVMLGLGARRRSRKRTAALMLLLLIGLMLLLVSCGGGGAGVTPQPQQFSTPAGTYTVTVMGTANSTLQHTTTVTFTVQ